MGTIQLSQLIEQKTGSEFEIPSCSEKGKYKLICDDEWGLNCQYFIDAPGKSLPRTGETE